MKTVYDRIEDVLKESYQVGVNAIAPHEFSQFSVDGVCGNEYVGCSESALGRRLREMREQGRVTSKTREGKTFKEFALAEAS